MNGIQLEAIVRPLATVDTQIVMEILGTLYDINVRPEWIEIPVNHEAACPTKEHPVFNAFSDALRCDGCGAVNECYYRIVVSPVVPRDPERVGGVLNPRAPIVELTPAERCREHGVAGS